MQTTAATATSPGRVTLFIHHGRDLINAAVKSTRGSNPVESVPSGRLARAVEPPERDNHGQRCPLLSALYPDTT